MAACGGGGATEPAAAGGGFVVLSFDQDGLDTVSLNSRLTFRFNAALDPDSVSAASVQVREGPSFGRTVAGVLAVDGDRLGFEPHLSGLCDQADGALKPATTYRVVLLGLPEAFVLRSVAGEALEASTPFEFRTRAADDPALYVDPEPDTAARVVAVSPADGEAAVTVQDGNRIVLTLDQNLRPCTVDSGSVRLRMAQVGDINAFTSTGAGGNPSGFVTAGGETGDQRPADPYSWGGVVELPAVTTLSEPQTIPAHVQLVQTRDGAEIHVTPDLGPRGADSFGRSRFPENALLVLEVSSDVEDYGGLPLVPFVMSFTTENLPAQEHAYVLENEGETPYEAEFTTADVNSVRAPGLAQAFLLFSGDGDNGSEALQPSLPQSDAGCASDYQDNDGTLDDFDPMTDVLLDTGTSLNTCPNLADGSRAVVWEFNTFRIRSGVTVRVVGRNPAILLVRGDVTIDAGGRLLVRGDGLGGAPQGAGEGNVTASTTAGTAGGQGVAGGGDGGSGPAGVAYVPRSGEHGRQGYYHATGQEAPAADILAEGGPGGGHGNISAKWVEQSNPNNRNTPSGGGGGHATAGADGTALGTGSLPTALDGPMDGVGGGSYGNSAGRLLKPEAGSGGGAGGELRPFRHTIGRGPGGAGGSGGGFVDLTSGGDMTILGTIDAAGSPGGSNPGTLFNPNYAWNPGTGGGGGGSGGGIRLLTPHDIRLGSTTLLTAAGGAGGAGGASQGTNPPLNNGGAGGVGRIVLEDSNSIITGLDLAAVVPGEGATGFRRGLFDGGRFHGGGLVSEARTAVFFVGALDPVFFDPVQDYVGEQDFVAGTSNVASRGVGRTTLLIEARGYELLPNGSADLTGAVAPPTAWRTVGHFVDSGLDGRPTWKPEQPDPSDLGGPLPTGNGGEVGLSGLDGREFLQLRFTFYLAEGVSAADPGHLLDRWVIRSRTDQ